jgi:hypothetical protein
MYLKILTFHWCWHLNSKYCPRLIDFEFIIPLNVLMTIQCTKASTDGLNIFALPSVCDFFWTKICTRISRNFMLLTMDMWMLHMHLRLTVSGMKGYKDIMTRDNCTGHGGRMYVMTLWGYYGNKVNVCENGDLLISMWVLRNFPKLMNFT